MRVKQPKWPIEQLVTFELRDYREDLERALAEFPDHAQPAERETLQQRLTEVISEQELRAGAQSPSEATAS
jgi:hypothetical protein